MSTSRSLVLVGTAAAALATWSAAAAGPAGARSEEKTAGRIQAFTFAIKGHENGGEVVAGPRNIAIAPGVPVRITVTNFTHEFHTFTVPGLHLSRLIQPAHRGTPRKTTFTFTTLRGGPLAWYCLICVDGGHGYAHAMGGTIWAIVDPALFVP